MPEQTTPGRGLRLDGLHLVVRQPGQADQQVELALGVYPVGSEENNRIVLTGDEVAWRHAIISFFEDGLWVEDLASTTGTFIEGERIRGREPVFPGQSIVIGPYVLFVRAAADSEPVPPPVPEPVKKEADPPPVSGRDDIDRRRAVKAQIQQELMKRLDLPRLTASHVGEKELHQRVRSTLEDIVGEAVAKLPPHFTPEALIKEMYDETVGLGPLEDLIEAADVTEVMVNGPNQVYVERYGKLELTDKAFLNDDSVLAVIERIVAPIGRRIDESQPYVDARLADGSRVNAIIPPLSLTGPCVTIRKFSKEPFLISDLIGFGTMTRSIASFIEACVLLRKNIVVSGGTGSGKTTLLNVLSSYIPDGDRILTIEDAAELRLTQEHVVRLEARPPNIEGRGAITIRDLVRNALRMRPDRIVVGECRGGEALDMLQAMNTGHDGSLTTVHANTPRDVISRLETMVLMSGMELPVRAIREQIGAAIHLIVHISRYSDGTRKIARISEVVGLEGDKITMQDIFQFEQTGVTPDGEVKGRFVPTGSVPTFMEEMKTRGVALDPQLFDPGVRQDD